MSRPAPSKAASGGAAHQRPLLLTPGRLREWPLPQPDAEGDKEERGRVLIVGGAPEMPGAVLLAATAALRAGAGKLQIATCESIAPHVAIAVPESRVLFLPETKTGAIAASAAPRIAEYAARAQAVLIGPGMVDEEAITALLDSLFRCLEKPPILVLDAAAMTSLAGRLDLLRPFGASAILTPHAGEMASLLGIDKKEVARDPLGTLHRAVGETGATIALKGAETYIAGPETQTYSSRAGSVGLATSGSGDTLAGLVAGLAARGAPPLQAACWGVSLHGRAGDRLTRRIGPLGFLARELLDEIPRLMAQAAAP